MILNEGKCLVVFKAVIVCDTDECDVTLKHELTHQLGASVKKSQAFKTHADQWSIFCSQL